MKNLSRGSTLVVIALVLAVLLIGSLGFIGWQNFIQPGRAISSDRVQSNEVSFNLIEGTYDKIVTSTLNGWTVTLQTPSHWSGEVDYDAAYNYDARQKEVFNVVTIVHPTEKVHITLRHDPFFSADGVCGASTISYLNKEEMADKRLVFVEAVGEGAFFLSATSQNVGAEITEDFNSCLRYRSLFNAEAKDVYTPNDDRSPHHKKPFVSVSITPTFVLDEDWDWDYTKIIDFLKSEEYREAKEIVKNLKI